MHKSGYPGLPNRIYWILREREMLAEREVIPCYRAPAVAWVTLPLRKTCTRTFFARVVPSRVLPVLYLVVLGNLLKQISRETSNISAQQKISFQTTFWSYSKEMLRASFNALLTRVPFLSISAFSY